MEKQRKDEDNEKIIIRSGIRMKETKKDGEKKQENKCEGRSGAE